MEFNDIRSTQQTIDFFSLIAAKRTVRQHLAGGHAGNSFKECVVVFFGVFSPATDPQSRAATTEKHTSHTMLCQGGTTGRVRATGAPQCQTLPPQFV